MEKNTAIEQASNFSQKEVSVIIWPKEYLPENADIHVSNEIYINAPPELVWNWIINAPLWPKWYKHATNVQITNQDENYLIEGTKFSWNVFGHPVQCIVPEYIQNERLSWIVRGDGIVAYHAWLIKKTDDGCYVLTEETQQGPAVIAGKKEQTNMMYDAHQFWLEQLKKKVEEVCV